MYIDFKNTKLRLSCCKWHVGATIILHVLLIRCFCPNIMHTAGIHIWRLWLQKRVSMTWISNYAPQYSAGCYFLFLAVLCFLSVISWVPHELIWFIESYQRSFWIWTRQMRRSHWLIPYPEWSMYILHVCYTVTGAVIRLPRYIWRNRANCR